MVRSSRSLAELLWRSFDGHCCPHCPRTVTTSDNLRAFSRTQVLKHCVFPINSHHFAAHEAKLHHLALPVTSVCGLCVNATPWHHIVCELQQYSTCHTVASHSVRTAAIFYLPLRVVATFLKLSGILQEYLLVAFDGSLCF